MQRAIALPPSLSALGLYNKAEATAAHTKNAKQLLIEAKEGSKEEEDAASSSSTRHRSTPWSTVCARTRRI